MQKKFKHGSTWVCLLLLLLSLSMVFEWRRLRPYRYTIPTKTDDGWEVSSLSREHLAAEPINQLFDRIADGTYKNIHSVLVVRNGKLITEEYFSGRDSNGDFRKYNRDRWHELASISKSVNSISIGIAIDQHLISGVNEKLSKLLPAYSKILAEKGKDSIRLVDLLTMRAGLLWDE